MSEKSRLFQAVSASLRAGNRGEAIRLLDEAIVAGANDPDVFSDLGSLLFQAGLTDAGIAKLQAAVSLPNATADHWTNLGFCLKHTRRFNDAIDTFVSAVARFPENPRLRWQLSLLLLFLGHYREGFAQYEWRWRWPEFPSRPRDFGVPQWTPGLGDDEVILVHGEQGFGDTIQFARWIPKIASRCQKLYFEVQPELYELFVRQGWPCEVVPQPTKPVDITRALPIMSIPHVLELEHDSDLFSPRYLKLSDAGSRNDFKSLKVGLAWRGRPTHGNDARRSLALKTLSPLFDIPGIHWVCLLAQDVSKEIADAGLDGRMEAAIKPGNSFDDTARRIAGLDLVITVDTSVAHLAAAGGKETWILLPQIPDWRWGVDGARTVWYESVRLFRCEADLAWQPVVEQVCRALSTRQCDGAVLNEHHVGTP